MWIREFEVRGSSNFPTDMLRYDSCYPASQESVSEMAYSTFRRSEPNTTFVVRLKHRDDTKNWKPTEGRWHSFGWRVDMGSYRAFKV